MPYKKVHDVVSQYCNVIGNTSQSAIGRGERKRMPSGPMSWKRTSNRPTNKFLEENIDCCQELLILMPSVF